jgi:peptidoglycan hydrolase CwlO-like protein
LLYPPCARAHTHTHTHARTHTHTHAHTHTHSAALDTSLPCLTTQTPSTNVLTRQGRRRIADADAEVEALEKEAEALLAELSDVTTP